MNKKGQALVEFVIILPIAMLLIFSIIDLGRLLYAKNDLDNVTTDVSLLYKNGNDIDEIKNAIKKENDYDVDIDISQREDYTLVVVKRDLKPITPGLNYIADKVFNIEASRVVYND